MKDRLITFTGALAVLFIALGLLLSNGSNQFRPASRPISHDSGEQGLAGATRWLQQSGVRVVALRDRYVELPRTNAAQRGNLLIVTEPSVYPPRPGELTSLKDWISRGNDILLLEALAARPAWTRASKPSTSDNSLMMALGLSSAPEPKEADPVCGGTTPSTDPERAASAPVLLKPHPSDIEARAVQGVREVRIKPETDGSRPAASPDITYRNGKDREIFDWLCDVPRGRSALRQFRLGAGRVWVSSYPQLFANRNLGLADNAQLLANLVGIAVTGEGAHRGAVIFDDMHQGDSALYDPAAFFSDPRLHASLWLLVAMWLLYLLGYSNRFAPVQAPRLRVTPSRFVESIGGFLARHLGGNAGADLLLRQLRNELARHTSTPASAATLPEMLARLPGLDADLPKRLQEAEQRLRTSGSRDLRPLARLIHQIRKQLQ